MKKYDCIKSCLAEMCDDCPLLKILKSIADCSMVSDNQEKLPKLTKKEHDFLATFLISANKAISRGKNINDLYIHDVISGKYFCIDPTMFFFIREGEQMTFDDLLKLEVEK